jgi:predicted nucleic acid-binding protein
MRRDPSLQLIRRLAAIPPSDQFTTAITLGELLYGAFRRDSARLQRQVREMIRGALTVLVRHRWRPYIRSHPWFSGEAHRWHSESRAMNR